MISLRIKDTKVFMSQLLIKDTFDRMLLSEATIKTACSYTINGNKVPAAMKLVMLASYELVTDIIAKNNIAVMPENVNGLFINMKYQEGHVDIITGTSLNVFTLDKQLDTAFDQYIKTFLANAGLDFEEL